MSYTVLDGPQLADRLRTALSDSDGKARLAVAYLGKDAPAFSSLENMKNLKLVCDFMSGGTNPVAIESLRKRGADVHHLDGLHAKVGIVGDSLSFVGSSNLTSNGLSEFGNNDAVKRYERTVVFDGIEPSVEASWNDMWKHSIQITPEMVEKAEAAFKIRQRHKAAEYFATKNTSLANLLIKSPELLDDLNVWVVVYSDLTQEEQPKFDDGLNEVHTTYSPEFDAYWDWEELPDHGYIIDFVRPNRGILGFRGLYFRDRLKFDNVPIKHGSFHAVFKVTSVEGVECNQSDATVFRKAFAKYRLQNPTGRDEAWCFPLSELAPFVEASA